MDLCKQALHQFLSYKGNEKCMKNEMPDENWKENKICTDLKMSEWKIKNSGEYLSIFQRQDGWILSITQKELDTVIAEIACTD